MYQRLTLMLRKPALFTAAQKSIPFELTKYTGKRNFTSKTVKRGIWYFSRKNIFFVIYV